MSILTCPHCGKIGDENDFPDNVCTKCGRPATEAVYPEPGEGPLARLGNGKHRKSDLEGAITHRREGQR